MGRQIFWVFIAGLSFTLGLLISSQYYSDQFGWKVLLISALIGVLGAVLALTFQRVAAGIAGFATGWYLSVVLLSYFNPNIGNLESAIPLLFGVLCGFVLMKYFDWGVIIASSVAGSAIIVSGMTQSQSIELAILGMFSVIGIAIQVIWFMQEK
jgi:hypothetical protein